MRNVSKWLFCCDTQEELMTLKENWTSDYLIATGRYEFYKEVCDCGETAVFLEFTETIPFEQVWEVLDQIHTVIDESGDFSCLFHFSYNIESGFSLKIAQLIIHINMIHTIVRNYAITEIALFDNKSNWTVNEALFLYAKSREMECHIWDSERKTQKTALKTLKTLEPDYKFAEDEEIFQKEKEKIALIRKTQEKKIQDAGREEEIGVLYCCWQPYDKHVDWLQRRLRIIGGEVRVICYYDTVDVKKIKEKGFSVDCLEDYFTLKAFDERYKGFIRERETILDQMRARLKIVYMNVDISEWLLLKIKKYYYRELIECLYIDVCARRYFSLYKYKFIHIWGNTNFWETWVCYDNTRDNKTKLFKIDTIGFNLFKSKQPYQYMLSAIFAPVKEVISQQFDGEFLGKTCFIRDAFWGERREGTRRKVWADKRKRLAFLPSGILGGFTTYQFYYGTLFPLIGRLLDGGYEVIFKNHPGLSDCWEEDVRNRFNDHENFTIIPAYCLVSDVLEQCDAIITDISSCAYDAAIAGKVVFCRVDAQGYELISWHEDGFIIYQDTDVMIEDIGKILGDENVFEEIIDRQSLYMERLLGDKRICMDGLVRRFLQELAVS